MGGLRERAEAWLAQDPDPATRAELRAILDSGDEKELAERFGARLEFGTAGLRGELGAGPNRMNRVTVMRAAAGLAARLLRDHPPGATVIVGFDARHGSRRFADDTAAVLTGAGLRAEVFAGPVPTPVVAHLVRTSGAVAGVVVTASHNPPRDNGYKVYLGDGGQIVPPLDAEISAEIDKVGRVDELPLGEGWAILGDDALRGYLDDVASLRLGNARDISVVYTPMHGVGRDVLLQAFERAGFPAPIVVPEQAEPDPDFPTVAFPNPEEPGALDLALGLAAKRSADLVIASDPDADRCAVAVPAADGWRALSGDEVGGLLAEHILAHTSGDDRLVVTTIVSSSLLGSIARAHGVRFAESLTGFKWIMRAGGPGDRLVFGYEEALGYSVGDDRGAVVNDKDGIGAALAVAALAAEARRAGRTLLDLLDDQARRYGLHATSQLSVRVADLSLIGDAMARLRAGPPRELGGRAVESFDDLARATGGLPPADGLRFRLAAGASGGSARVVIRPSGTEPKLKCYLEVVLPADQADMAAVRDRAAAELDALRADVSVTLGLD